jgi:hypothetical protein
VTTPLLPCADIDEITEFSTMLGFGRSFRQLGRAVENAVVLADSQGDVGRR